MPKNLIIGAGFSGATMANLIATKLNQKVLIIDKKDHIAGNSYDYKDENGISIHKYGSHIFHTSNEEVWNYIRQFTDFNQYMHKVVALIDGIETTIPFNIKTLYDVFPSSLAKRLEEKLLLAFEYNKKIPILEFKKQDDKDLKFLADYVYEKVFLHYTTKQWGSSPDTVDGAITARVPVYISQDSRYFQDTYQGIPSEGYTKTVEKMLDHPNIEMRLSCEFAQVKDTINEYQRIFYTGSIDEFFDFKFGKLPYRSVNFTYETHDCEYYQSNAVINYPCNYDFTRIHEFKYYLNEKSTKTVIAKEYSEFFELGKNERYYPIPSKENEELHAKYLEEAASLQNVYFLGRLGDYKYYDMDKAILRGLECFDEVFRVK